MMNRAGGPWVRNRGGRRTSGPAIFTADEACAETPDCGSTVESPLSGNNWRPAATARLLFDIGRTGR